MGIYGMWEAQTAGGAATCVTGAGAGTGTGTIADYTSPFQQQVIDTTLQEFDKQRQEAMFELIKECRATNKFKQAEVYYNMLE